MEPFVHTTMRPVWAERPARELFLYERLLGIDRSYHLDVNLFRLRDAFDETWDLDKNIGKKS